MSISVRVCFRLNEYSCVLILAEKTTFRVTFETEISKFIYLFIFFAGGGGGGGHNHIAEIKLAQIFNGKQI